MSDSSLFSSLSSSHSVLDMIDSGVMDGDEHGLLIYGFAHIRLQDDASVPGSEAYSFDPEMYVQENVDHSPVDNFSPENAWTQLSSLEHCYTGYVLSTKKSLDYETKRANDLLMDNCLLRGMVKRYSIEVENATAEVAEIVNENISVIDGYGSILQEMSNLHHGDVLRCNARISFMEKNMKDMKAVLEMSEGIRDQLAQENQKFRVDRRSIAEKTEAIEMLALSFESTLDSLSDAVKERFVGSAALIKNYQDTVVLMRNALTNSTSDLISYDEENQMLKKENETLRSLLKAAKEQMAAADMLPSRKSVVARVSEYMQKNLQNRVCKNHLPYFVALFLYVFVVALYLFA